MGKAPYIRDVQQKQQKSTWAKRCSGKKRGKGKGGGLKMNERDKKRHHELCFAFDTVEFQAISGKEPLLHP